MANHQLQEFISTLARGEDLNRVDAEMFLQSLLDGDATDSQIAEALLSLNSKGETVAELAGMTTALRSRAVRLNSQHDSFIDTAGTGSSKVKTFNISTAAAFVIAGAGLPVAKHGNRAASSKAGSADVLAALGANISTPPKSSERALNEIGICFMFAPLYHGATARVAAVRRQLGIHTCFNLLGPLSNPAGAPFQIVGVWKFELAAKLAHVLAELGTRRSWVVHGEDGLDEITLDGRTWVAECFNGSVNTFWLVPEDFGLTRRKLDHLRGGDVESNAAIIHEVLSGKRHDEARDLVVMTAAAALLVGGISPDLMTATEAAKNSIDSGGALTKLRQLVTHSSK